MPVVDTVQTFNTGDTVTSTTLNNIMDQSIFVAGAVVSGSGLDITAGGQMTISDNSLPGGKITDGTITSAKIENGTIVNDDINPSAAIVGSKLANLTITAAQIANDAVTTVKVLDANITPAKLSQPLTLATAQASTSGTSIDFTSIPSWVKKITITFSGVSTNGSSGKRVRLGTSSGFVSTGYLGVDANISSGAAASSITDGFGLRSFTAADILHGIVTIVKVSGNTWAANGSIAYSNLANISFLSGSIALADVLTQVRITTINGTDTFDAGLINIMYE